MKKLTTAIAVATLTVSAPALADTTTVTTPTTTEVSTQDLAFAFDDAENLQAVVMTNDEMADTEGAIAPIAAYGIRMGVMGTVGAAGNAWNHYNNTGQFSWGAAGRGFVVGAVGGGVSKYLGGRGW